MTPPNPPLKISAKHLGPIMALDGNLTKHAQNLIFARNGTGKSFLSRALRCFDRHTLGLSLDEASKNLVSDESPDGTGTFSLKGGDTCNASIQFDRATGGCTVTNESTIFHVFSEDFVSEELREQSYLIDGNITNQIAVDSTNIEVTEADKELANAMALFEQKRVALASKLATEKVALLVNKAGVHKTLKQYGEITFDELRDAERPEIPAISFQQRLLDLDALKGIPADPDYPDAVAWVGLANLDCVELSATVERVTSPSSVGDELKAKINRDPDFFRAGVVSLAHNKDSASCPFCEQNIEQPHTRLLIDGYIAYFADAEENHKSELRTFYSQIHKLLRDLTLLENGVERQKARFNILKNFLPSRRSQVLADTSGPISAVQRALSDALAVVQRKGANVSRSEVFDAQTLLAAESDLLEVLKRNNITAASLCEAIRLSDAERKLIHRDICRIFGDEFLIANWADLENLRRLRVDVIEKTRHLEALQRNAPSQDARTRVARTFGGVSPPHTELRRVPE